MAAINLNAINDAIKRAGSTNVRVVPMAGQGMNGQHQIEVREGTSWVAIAEGVSASTAQQMVQQATNRVLLG